MTAQRQHIGTESGSRSELAVLLAGISRKRSEYQAIIAQHGKLRALIVAEGKAQAELDEVKRRDAEALAALLIGSTDQKASVNHGDQNKAEKELARAKREADVARACEPAVNERMAESSFQIDTLERQIIPQVAEIMLTDARALAAEINADAKRLRAKYSKLWGLRRYVGDAPALRKRLNDVPMPTHPDHITPDGGELMSSVATWHSYAVRLAADPGTKFKE